MLGREWLLVRLAVVWVRHGAAAVDAVQPNLRLRSPQLFYYNTMSCA